MPITSKLPLGTGNQVFFHGNDEKIAKANLLGKLTQLDNLKREGYLRYHNGRYLLSPIVPPKLSVRQTVLSGQLNPDGSPGYLEKRPGMKVAIAPDTLIAFAAGFDGAGPVDFVEKVIEEGVWEIPPESTRYLYVERNPDGSLSYGSANQPPQYEYVERPKCNEALNLTSTGGSAIASGSWDSVRTPTKAFILNDDHWSSAEITSATVQGYTFIGWDFGEGNSQEVRKILIEQHFMAQHKVAAVWFEVSNDLVSWETVCRINLEKFNGSSYADNFYPSYRIPKHGKWRAFRLRAADAVGINGSWSIRYLLPWGEDVTRDNHFFDISKMVMFDAGVPVERVFVGEVLTDKSRIVNLKTYATNGRDRVRWGISSSYIAQNLNYNHNLGCAPLISAFHSALSHNYYNIWGTTNLNTLDGWYFFPNTYNQPTWDNLKPDYVGLTYHLNTYWYSYPFGVAGHFSRNGFNQILCKPTYGYDIHNLTANSANYIGLTLLYTSATVASMFLSRGW